LDFSRKRKRAPSRGSPVVEVVSVLGVVGTGGGEIYDSFGVTVVSQPADSQQRGSEVVASGGVGNMPVSRWSAPPARPPAIARARLRGRPRRTLSAPATHTGCRGGRGQRCPGQVGAHPPHHSHAPRVRRAEGEVPAQNRGHARYAALPQAAQPRAPCSFAAGYPA